MTTTSAKGSWMPFVQAVISRPVERKAEGLMHRTAIHECAHWTFGELIGWPGKELSILPVRPGKLDYCRRIRIPFDVLWQVEQEGGNVEVAAFDLRVPDLFERWESQKVGYAKANLLIVVAGIAAVNEICQDQLRLEGRDLKNATAFAEVVTPRSPAAEIQRAMDVVKVACRGPVGATILAAAQELETQRHINREGLRQLWERIKPPAECFLGGPGGH